MKKVLILVLVFMFIGCSSNSRRPIRQGTSTEALRDKAVMLLERGEYQKASIGFEQVIKKEGGNLYYISNGNEWLATDRIEKVLFNLGKCYENIAKNETDPKLKREFEWKALRAYEQQTHRQKLLVRRYNYIAGSRLPDDYIEFSDNSKHHAPVLLLALKVCGYNEYVLRLEFPNLYKEFRPFAFTFLDREKKELRIAFMSPRAANYPQRCLAVGTFKEGKLTWLEYRGQEVANIPRRVQFTDVDSDGKDEVVLVRTVNVTKWDKAEMVLLESREVKLHTVLNVLDEEVILLKEEQLPWSTF